MPMKGNPYTARASILTQGSAMMVISCGNSAVILVVISLNSSVSPSHCQPNTASPPANSPETEMTSSIRPTMTSTMRPAEPQAGELPTSRRALPTSLAPDSMLRRMLSAVPSSPRICQRCWAVRAAGMQIHRMTYSTGPNITTPRM